MNSELKKSMQKVKNFEATLKSIDKFIADEYLDATGSAQINILLYDTLAIFDPLSMDNQLELNSEIYQFLDSKIYPIPIKYPIKLNFYGHNLTPIEKNQISNCIKKHYSLILQDKKLDLHINSLKILGLSVLGITLLALYFFLEIFSTRSIFMELLSIAGTFSLWEAVDFYLLERKTIKFEWLTAGQTALSEIVFCDRTSINSNNYHSL